LWWPHKSGSRVNEIDFRLGPNKFALLRCVCLDSAARKAKQPLRVLQKIND
jgi:hypothetical protein